MCQFEGKLHGDDGEGAQEVVLPAAAGRGFHPVQAVRTRKLPDHEWEQIHCYTTVQFRAALASLLFCENM